MTPLAFRSPKTRLSPDDPCASLNMTAPSPLHHSPSWSLKLSLRGQGQARKQKTCQRAAGQHACMPQTLFYQTVQPPDTHSNYLRSLSTTLYNYFQLCSSSVLGDLLCIDWRNIMGFNGTTFLYTMCQKKCFRRFNIEGPRAPLRFCHL